MNTAANRLDVVMLDAISDHYGRLRNGAKLLARDAGDVSPRTAENWLARKCVPQLRQVGALLLQVPELRRRFYAALEADCVRLEASIAERRRLLAEPGPDGGG